jgi:NADH-quinone oxidoreductase subunit D
MFEDPSENNKIEKESNYFEDLEKNLLFYFSEKIDSMYKFENDMLCEVSIENLEVILEGLKNNLEFSLNRLNYINAYESKQRSFLLINLSKDTNKNSTFIKVRISKNNYDFELKKTFGIVTKYFKEAARFEKGYEKSNLYNDLKIYDQMPEGLDCIDIHADIAGENIADIFLDEGKAHVHKFFDFENDDISKIIAKISLLDHKAGIFPEICFCMGIENYLKVKVPKRAQYIRMLLSELYRMSNHLSYIANMSELLDSKITFNLALIEREQVFRIIEHITGSRVHPNFIRVGGIKKDITDENITMIDDSLVGFFKAIRNIEKIMLNDPIIFKTLDGCAPISSSKAVEMGLSGPNLRSSGIRYDLRKNEKHLFYEDIAFVIPLGRKGDCLDRLIVRFKEFYQSLKIIKQIIEKMPIGAVQLMLPPSELDFAYTAHISTNECPHGIMKLFFELEEKRLSAFLSVCASKKNLYAAEKILKGSRFDDLNIIIASFDLCPSELLDFRW